MSSAKLPDDGRSQFLGFAAYLGPNESGEEDLHLVLITEKNQCTTVLPLFASKKDAVAWARNAYKTAKERWGEQCQN